MQETMPYVPLDDTISQKITNTLRVFITSKKGSDPYVTCQPD